MTKLHLQKAFFGKNNCLKITLNNNMECYFEFGTPKKETKDGWNWKPVKFSDIELGEIISVLEGEKEGINFFHDFKGDKTQIWIKKTDKFFSIKVKELSKGLNNGEQIVLREILKHIIVRMNIKI